MQKLIVVAILASLGWYAYGKYQSRVLAGSAPEVSDSTRPVPLSASPNSGGATFRCDGRIYCSQMTSCAEATYFLSNCPGTKMDGNGDGVPCEKQWCN